ncbi:hypothetical protein PAHAL_6G110300 [Panicum hallii]|uniref:Uncharacterized protein n=1 Tax=Panicum hallii TaxID=206008 RepID=A0A2T8IFZ7_9POAL|nr:hypothetical protein PAHAL_6G110300 [Panicum hallii]
MQMSRKWCLAISTPLIPARVRNSPRGKRRRGHRGSCGAAPRQKIDHEREQERRSDGRCAEQTRRIAGARVQQGALARGSSRGASERVQQGRRRAQTSELLRRGRGSSCGSGGARGGAPAVAAARSANLGRRMFGRAAAARAPAPEGGRLRTASWRAEEWG